MKLPKNPFIGVDFDSTIDDLFRKYDAEGNDNLTVTEFKNFLEDSLGLEIDSGIGLKLFNIANKGGSDSIDRNEFRSFCEKLVDSLSPAEKETQRELLSHHEAYANYDGMKIFSCKFLTSLCPNKCSHGGKAAEFTIFKYIKYSKPGKYGDSKQNKFHIKEKDLSQQQKTIIEQMQPGQQCSLVWDDEYVKSDSGSASPERSLRSIQMLEIVQQILAQHSAEAVYKGKKFMPCMYLTALCPDKCSHGGEYATFDITKYLHYEKIDKYGSDKAGTFNIRMSDLPEELFKKIDNLQSNDTVYLDWDHNRVIKTFTGEKTFTTSGGENVITRLKLFQIEK